MVDVSIRPPALECLLAREMLQIALNKLTNDAGGGKQGVDLILYLGDAANSGGADEIEKVLTILTSIAAKRVSLFTLLSETMTTSEPAISSAQGSVLPC